MASYQSWLNFILYTIGAFIFLFSGYITSFIDKKNKEKKLDKKSKQ